MGIKSLKKIKVFMNRNKYGLRNIPSKPNCVNVEAFPIKNIGDTLGPIIVNWMLEKEKIDSNIKTKNTRHLLSVGSVASFGYFDATIWGSGILNEKAYSQIKKRANYFHRKLDVRAVRGPYTREALMNAGYDCPETYGDPAILLPMLYPAKNNEKKHKVSIVLHHLTTFTNVNDSDDKENRKIIDEDEIKKNGLKIIDPITYDYKSFVDEITASEFIISSSLHGIIIAEAYGVPSVFLNMGVDDQNLKFKDWYESTNREMIAVKSIEEALSMERPQLSELQKLQEGLINSFPYDLWK